MGPSRHTFDITRDAGRHLSFGQGAHACAGQALARLETTAFLRALIARVDRIELTGEPKWALNNIIRRHELLPLRLVSKDKRAGFLDAPDLHL